MAIAFGAYTTGSNSGLTSLTFSSPSVSGTDTIGIVDVFYQSGLNDVSGVTWNGVAMTKVTSKGQESDTRNVDVWYIIAPSTGVTNIVVSRATGTGALRGDASYYTGAKQTGQPDSFLATGPTTTTNFAPTTTVVAPNSWLHLIARNDTTNYTSTVTGGIIRSAVGNPAVFDSNGVVGTGSQSITVTTGSSAAHIGIMISIAPAAAAASNPSTLLLMGVG